MPGHHAELLAAFVNAPSGVALVTEDGSYVSVNPAAERLFDRPAEELLRLRWQDLVHPADLRTGEQAVHRALAETGEIDEEVRALRPDGGEIWVRVRASVVEPEEAGPARFVLHYEDVTARRASDGQIRLLAAVMAQVEDAVVVTDRGGRILLLNGAAEDLYGRLSVDVAGRDAAETLVHPESQEQARAWQTELGAGDPARESRLKHRRGDGSPFDAEVQMSPVRGDDGGLLGMAGVVRDVSVRREREESAAMLAAVVDAAAEGIIGVDDRDVIRFFSPSAERVFGWRAEEVVGGPAWILAGDPRRAEARELRAEMLAGRSVHREAVVRLKGGAELAVSLTASPIAGPDGRYEGAAITVLDLSERRRAERDADHSRHLLQHVIDHAPIVVWLKDLEGRSRLINRRGAALLGLEQAQVTGRTDFDVFPPELATRHRAEDLNVIETGAPMTFVDDLPLPDGDVHPYLVTKFPIAGPDGEPDGVGLVAADIAEVRRGEADRATLVALIQAAPDAIITQDRDGRIGTWNPGAERMFGLTAEEAVGMSYEEIVAENERDLYHELRVEVVAGRTLVVRMEGLRADGSTFPTEVSAGPLRAKDGSHAGIVAIVRDISELIEAELELRERAARLERSNTELERFAYAASHDLQEPLRSIQMSAEAVLSAAAERLDEDERPLLRHIAEAAERMAAQVSAIMQVARVSLGREFDAQVPVELALEDALNALRAAIVEAGAEIEVDGPLPAAAIPRAEMALVLQNLLANAIKFHREGEPPRVTVSGGAAGDCVEVRVADQGIGLSEADRAHVIGVYGRTRPGAPGTGMGLAVCRRIVERRGGSITAQSAGHDRGSQFTVRLPAPRGG
jgi:PAS domain S-box-containing protein